MKRYAIVVEDAGSNFAAYVPDLPGVSRRATPWRKWKPRFARQFSCTWKDWSKTGFPSPSRRAESN